MLLLLQLHHLHTLLLLPHSYISALCSRICLPDLLHSYLTLHNFLANITRLVNTRVIFLLAGGVVHVHHLHLAQGPLLLHLLVVHLCAAVVEISCHIVTNLYFYGHHLLQHLHLTLLHVDGVADPTGLLLHDHDSPDIHTDSKDSKTIPHHPTTILLAT